MVNLWNGPSFSSDNKNNHLYNIMIGFILFTIKWFQWIMGPPKTIRDTNKYKSKSGLNGCKIYFWFTQIYMGTKCFCVNQEWMHIQYTSIKYNIALTVCHRCRWLLYFFVFLKGAVVPLRILCSLLHMCFLHMPRETQQSRMPKLKGPRNS